MSIAAPDPQKLEEIRKKDRRFSMGKMFRYTKLHEKASLHPPARPGDVGYDLSAIGIHKFNEETNVVLLRTGIALQLPQGYYGQVFSRSSTGLKKGLMIANSVGIIDNGYRGELYIPVTTTNQKNAKVAVDELLKSGPARIAQLVLAPFHVLQMDEVEGDLPPTERGSGGIGSTG